MYPLKFEPILKQTLWGGDKIIPFKNLNSDLKGVGESWEISGVEGNESVVANGPEKGLTLTDMVKRYREELVGEANYARFGNKFPLLIKFIDAKQDLSIQVHPSDELAKKRHNSMGKTEMWYVVNADKGAKLRSGFSEEITPKEYKDRVLNNTITDVLQEYEVHPGDVFFLPAGRVHSIGAGSFIAEIQQTSDIKDEPVELVACPYFTTSLYDMTEEISCDYSELDSFVIFICMEGACKMKDNEGHELSVRAGETILLPATTQDLVIPPEEGGVKLMETYV